MTRSNVLVAIKNMPPPFTRYASYMRLRVTVLLALIIVAAPATAQGPRVIVASAGVGGTYYCIVSRCGTGSLIGATGGIEVTRVLVLEAGVRRHFCADCGRFVIGELAMLLQYPGSMARPFVAVGLSYSSDADFMGRHAGLLAGTGASFWLRERWGLRVDVRGRRVGRGDAMGEVSLSLAHRFRGSE